MNLPLALLLVCSGCGTTREKLATEQLLLSDAVDRAVADIDFSPLENEKVFLDRQYITPVQGRDFVNASYIVSSLRQQMVLHGCLLQDNREDADYVVEPRVGTLGTDGHNINYGIPASNGLSAAASLVSPQMQIPAIPEISISRRTDDSAAAKIAVFAYHRETKQPVWQSGTSVARSTARSRWILGAGPFESGSIYDRTRFAANPFKNAPNNDLADDAYRNSAVWDANLNRKLARHTHDDSRGGHLANAEVDESARNGAAGSSRAVDATAGVRVADQSTVSTTDPDSTAAQ